MSKTSYVAAFVVAVWFAIALRWGESMTANVGLMIGGVIATAFAVWYIKSSQDFAERNPGQALLDGAEFLEYHRMEVAAKGVPSLPNQPLIEIGPSQGEGSNGG